LVPTRNEKPGGWFVRPIESDSADVPDQASASQLFDAAAAIPATISTTGRATGVGNCRREISAPTARARRKRSRSGQADRLRTVSSSGLSGMGGRACILKYSRAGRPIPRHFLGNGTDGTYRTYKSHWSRRSHAFALLRNRGCYPAFLGTALYRCWFAVLLIRWSRVRVPTASLRNPFGPADFRPSGAPQRGTKGKWTNWPSKMSRNIWSG